MENPIGAELVRPVSRRHCRIALGLATAWMLAQALALDLEVVPVGKWPAYSRGPAQAVAVQGDYAYVAAEFGGLIIIDIHDPADPQRVGGYDTGGYAHGLAVAGNYAYVADGTNGVQLIDIRDPANPQRVGGYDTTDEARGVAVQGDYAYVAAQWGGLMIVDIRNPANPQRVGGYATSGSAEGVAVAGNYAYVAEEQAGLEVIDLINLARDGFHFLVTGAPGQKVRVQRSRNLRDWEDWQQVTLGTEPADVTDTDTLSAPCGFYRAVAP